VGLNWVPGHAGVRGNENTDKLARDGSVLKFIGPEPFSGISRQNIRRKIKRWMDNQHLVLWCGPCSTQREARELISGPNLARRATLLSINRTEPRAVIGLLTGDNTLRRRDRAITPFVGSVVLRRKPQSTSCVCMRPWLHSDTHIWARFGTPTSHEVINRV
jgi:hypothetical protein